MQVDPRKVNLAEADIEQYLFENPQLVTAGGSLRGVRKWVGRQVSVPSGIIDLLGITYAGELVLVEIKNTELKAEHITQAKRYVFDLDSVIDRHLSGVHGNAVGLLCTPVLIGTSVSDRVFRECEACGVLVMTFGVSFAVDFSPVTWTNDFRTKRMEQWGQLEHEGALAAYLDMLDETFRQVDADMAAGLIPAQPPPPAEPPAPFSILEALFGGAPVDNTNGDQSHGNQG